MAIMSCLLLLGVSGPIAAAAPSAVAPAFKQVEAGTYYSVALRSDGSVWTWGRNLYGELGIEKKVSIIRFPTPLRLPNLSKIIGISVDGDTGYQLGVQSDGTVWEWGRDLHVYQTSILPRKVKGITGAVAITSSGDIASALLKDGTVVTWLRLGSEDDSQVKAFPVSGLQNVASIKHDGRYGYAITKDGSVYAWLSKVDANQKLVMGRPYKLQGLAQINQLGVSWGMGQAIDSSGRACSWKLDPYAAASSPGLKVVEKPACVSSPFKLKEVKQQAGNLLLTDSGIVYAVNNGKLAKVNGLPAITAISTSGYHQLAMDKQGQIWGWGANKWYETGSEASSADGMVYKPVALQRGVDLFINGQLVNTTVPAYASGASVQIPIKQLAQRLGIQFTAINGLSYISTFTLSKGDKTLTITREGLVSHAELNGQPVALTNELGSSADTVTVPYETLALLGITVVWDEASHRLKLSY